MLRKLHKNIGKLIYNYTQEPISTRSAPKPNMQMQVTHFVRRILGLHYYE